MLKENLQNILNSIKQGNNLGEEITLVGATKMVSAEKINEAISYGLKVVAENKVQEFREKNSLIKGASQHFIGHLQTNKVKYLIGKVDVIQSVDSIHLAKEINNQAKKLGCCQGIFAEVNVANELSKSGFTLEEIFDSVKQLEKLENIKLKGLMAMLPNLENKEELVSLCLKMREIFDKLKQENEEIKYLSMGMSGDYEIAINNGSNMIRLGSKIFGKRNYGEK